MVNLTGSFQHVKSENYLEHLEAIGAPNAKTIAENTSNLVITHEGDKIAINSGNHVYNLVLNKEVEETFNKISVKSTATLSDETLIVKLKWPGNGLGNRTYNFANSELIVTSENSNTTIIAKRHYKRV